MDRIAIVGSGLSALSAAKILIKRGVKPIILDVGETLDSKRKSIVSGLSALEPKEWDQQDRDFISANPTIANKKGMPKKMAFGSDYFYGDSRKYAPIETDGLVPPLSYAMGGLSVGWGASVLPADNCDLEDWPIKNRDLSNYYKKALDGLPYSCREDGLSKSFPSYSNGSIPLNQDKVVTDILSDLDKCSHAFSSNEFLFGNSRLLVRSVDKGDFQGCKYCGLCMSGCVYGCIYKSSQDIEGLLSSHDIDYIPGVFVHSLKEENNCVQVKFYSKTGQFKTSIFSRVFLAAGAVGSTRIVMQSKKLYDDEVPLLSTVGFIAPMWRLKKMPLSWPNTNTQPDIFLEFKDYSLSNHWIHAQISRPNELVLEKLGVHQSKQGVLQSIRRKMSEHLLTALCNIHSDHSNGYYLSLTENKLAVGTLRSRREQSEEAYQAIKKISWRLFALGRKIGCYTMIPFIQNSINSVGYHVGGSLPMKSNPQRETDTNLLGNPKAWQRVHVIDSSVFPSLPGTTIGLLAMANAARIASEVEL